jgi:hypothetical protein
LPLVLVLVLGALWLVLEFSCEEAHVQRQM